MEHPSFLVGPTASGKSAVALRIAAQADMEIISLDSMAVYRGIDILTDKPTPEVRARVRHHLIDVLDPWQVSSVARFTAMARDAVEDVRARGKRALIVGGTPMYLKGMIDDK